MTAKEYLEQVKQKDAKIKNLRRDKASVEDMLYSFGLSRAGGGERVQTSRKMDKIGELYSRLDEIEHKIDQQIGELMQFRMKVSCEINELKNEKYMIILNCRYIHLMSWEKIAENALDHPYTVRHIQKLNGYALLDFEEEYKEMLEAEQAKRRKNA